MRRRSLRRRTNLLRTVACLTSGSALLIELPETLDSFLAERRRISSDAGLACLFHAGHSPVEGCDQLLKLTREIVRGYLHEFTAACRASRRETFQISPQFPHRQ
jgi:hypothetical protein